MKHNQIVLSGVLKETKAKRPLVHQITNYVSAQLQADIVAIVGGCSIMSHLTAEMDEVSGQSDALLINIGTPMDDYLEICRTAMTAAKRRKIPTVLDLVGYGFTGFRNKLVDSLLEEFSFAVIKGNNAEILALAGIGEGPRGVSATSDGTEMKSVVEQLAGKYGCTVFSTGAVDALSDGETSLYLKGGSPLVTSRSGIGCALGSIAALFSCVTTPLAASAAACSAFRLAAQRAAFQAEASASFYCAFQDELYLLNEIDSDWRDLIVR